MTTLTKPVTRKAYTQPAAHGVRPELVISLHPGGIIAIREVGRRAASEICVYAASIYVDAIRAEAAAKRAEKRKARAAKRRR
jgi:hypothetical protein